MKEHTNQAEAIQITETILNTMRPERWFKWNETAYVTDDGFAIVTNEDYRFTLGFGVLRGVTVTIDLLKSVDDWNKRSMTGFVWLSENNDNDWCIVWGDKLILDHLNGDSYGMNLANPLLVYDEWLPQIQEFFARFGGSPFWSERTLSPSEAYRLVVHIH